MTEVTVAIIGAAGRWKNEMAKFEPKLYQKAVNLVHYIITQHFKLDPSNVTLVSGGSAGIDAIAPILSQTGFYKDLIIYTPADFDEKNKEFDPKSQCGRRLNQLHREFSEQIKSDSLSDLAQVKSKLKHVSNDFHGRNKYVAQSDFMIALTFSDTKEPKEGGTKHTWDLYRGKYRIHLSLSQL